MLNIYGFLNYVGVPPVVPELNGDDDTSNFDDVGKPNIQPQCTIPTFLYFNPKIILSWPFE